MDFSELNSTNYYRQAILNSTKALEEISHENKSIFWLADEIRFGKKKLRYNSVEFIIGKFFSRNQRSLFSKRGFVDIYVIGTFKTKYIPIEKVANAFTSFYLEMNILPNIIPISKSEFVKNIKFSISKIKNGVLLYDRERDIH